MDVIVWIKIKLGETVGSKRRIAYQAARVSHTDANKPKLVFDNSSPVFAVSPFALGADSLASWNPGAT
jgi:hypothetical protein